MFARSGSPGTGPSFGSPLTSSRSPVKTDASVAAARSLYGVINRSSRLPGLRPNSSQTSPRIGESCNCRRSSSGPSRMNSTSARGSSSVGLFSSPPGSVIGPRAPAKWEGGSYSCQVHAIVVRMCRRREYLARFGRSGQGEVRRVSLVSGEPKRQEHVVHSPLSNNQRSEQSGQVRHAILDGHANDGSK